MISANRQYTEICEVLEAIQACVDREGWVIPCRAADFAEYVTRARELMGVRS